ncbi:MAG: sigma-70 family RNA polymerase sigma factor [Burkholderiaceae bacterium]|nr:sigma-70 family RNA polymerase sigma factor [Burkholderiaceae bacterium]
MEPPTTDIERDDAITATVMRERGRLGNFIRRRVSDAAEAEDILQDVFQSFVEAYRLPEPIEQAGAWMFRAARNLIIDRFRKKREVLLEPADDDDEYNLGLDLPSLEDGPEAAYARAMLLDRLQAALEELPSNQREVFVAHELDGVGFKQLAQETGVALNTLLARKRYAVLHLRERLRDIYEEWE